MFRAHRIAGAMLVAACTPAFLAAQSRPTIEQFLSPGSPLEIRAAKRADRVGWVANPSHDPNGGGRYVLFVKDSQTYRVRVASIPGGERDGQGRNTIYQGMGGAFLNRFVWKGETPPSVAEVKK